MDLSHFFRERTKFVSNFYDNATNPFIDIIRKIEEEEPPYQPTWRDDGEPQYLDEWIEANASIEIIGQTCVSILSESLKLFLEEWVSQLKSKFDIEMDRSLGKSGYLNFYRQNFEKLTGVNWSNSEADLSIIEQVIFARNDSQHPKRFFSMEIFNEGATSKYSGNLFFVRKWEASPKSDESTPLMSMIGNALHIDRDKLHSAIHEMEKLTLWLEDHRTDLTYPQQRGF